MQCLAAMSRPAPSRGRCSTAAQRPSRPNCSSRRSLAQWRRPVSVRDMLKGKDDGEGMDATDAKQQVDIERLICHTQELQDKVEELEGYVVQLEERVRDRAVALRSIIMDDKEVDSLLLQDDTQLEVAASEQKEPWDSYRNSFSLLMSKGYLRTVQTLRNKLMIHEWELGLRPIALELGVSRFEAWCAANQADVSYEAISELYRDPADLSVITAPQLRMQARSMIKQAETEARVKAFADITAEAQRLSQQFAEGEFISKCIPDPIEHGLVDAFRKVVIPMGKLMGK